MKKFIALFLVFSLLALSGNLIAKERRGAEIVVQKSDGQQVRGELIAVKEHSLLLLERESGADVSVGIGDIRLIKLVIGSKAFIGFLVGGAIGTAVGFAQGDDPPTYSSWDIIDFDFITKAEHKAVVWGLGVGLLGAIIGKLASKDETYLFEGRSPYHIEFALEKLRKKARVTNFQ